MHATERNNVQRRRSVAAVPDQLPRTLNQRPLSECGASAQCFIRSLARCHGQAPLHNPYATRSDKMLSLCSCSCARHLVQYVKMPHTFNACNGTLPRATAPLSCCRASSVATCIKSKASVNAVPLCSASFAHWRDARHRAAETLAVISFVHSPCPWNLNSLNDKQPRKNEKRSTCTSSVVFSFAAAAPGSRRPLRSLARCRATWPETSCSAAHTCLSSRSRAVRPVSFRHRRQAPSIPVRGP